MIAALALVTALAARVDGTVTVSPDVRVLRSHELVLEGEKIRLPKGSRVVLLCSTDRWVSVAGPREWLLSGKACEVGTAVTPGAYRELAAEGGRIRAVGAGIAIEIETRTGQEATLAPILLAPRNTAVIDPRPTILWTPVPRATEYAIEWLGGGASTTRIAADEVHCVKDVCAAPYPADRASLAANVPTFVSVACRIGVASPWRREKEAAEVRLLAPDARQSLRKRLDAIEALPADTDWRNLLTAGAYADSGVLYEAWKRYTKLATPAAWVTAGDLATEMDLPALALREFTRASDAKSPPAVRAAAALGLGRLALALHGYEDARAQFELARKGFASLHLAAEESAARAGLEQAMRMLERRSE